ncbi:MAG TPA: hypothetical protein VIL71_08990 [Spirillospora sp.]
MSGREKKKSRASWIVFAVFAAIAVADIIYNSNLFGKDPDESAPVFGPHQVGRLVEQLSTAADAQGVCYGWVINSGRWHKIPTVTPSYRGTFRPHPPPRNAVNAASPSPAVPPGPGRTPSASPAPSPGATGQRFPSAGPTRQPTRRPTRQQGRQPAERPTLDPRKRQEIEQDLQMLDYDGVEYGSNLGPGKDPRQALDQCPEWVVLQAKFGYSESDKEYLYSDVTIKSSFEGKDLWASDYERKLGQYFDYDLIDDYGTDRLRDAIAALPMWIADQGLAPPVPAETTASTPPPDDKLAKPTITARRVWSVIGYVLIGGAVLCLVVGGVKTRRRRST